MKARENKPILKERWKMENPPKGKLMVSVDAGFDANFATRSKCGSGNEGCVWVEVVL